jgi:NAD(P)H-hydrate epimerase
MRIATAAEMAELDREAQEVDRIPGILLMEHAALAVLRVLDERYGPLLGLRVEIVCGVGNNAGDGFALARLLLGGGARPRVHQVGDPGKVRGDAAANREALAPLGIPVLEGVGQVEPEALLVDALLGTGATGAPRGAFEEALESLEGRPGPVVAVDIPTGVPADGGEPPGVHLPADVTVTMGLPKPFAACPVAAPLAGDVVVASIGFPPRLVDHERFRLGLTVAGVAARWVEPRDPAAHKGTAGRVLVIAGSAGLSGAAALTCRGALRAGAGLVRLWGPAGSARDLGASLPEVMVTERGPEGLDAALEWADAVVLGPGLGAEVGPFEKVVAGYPGPLILDADGLRLAEAVPGAAGPRVLTPHPGEAARILGAPVGPDLPARLEAFRSLQERLDALIVLKGRYSLVAGEVGAWVNGSGSPALATGGTGDVLAGVLGAGLAAKEGRSPAERVALGVYLHGVAGTASGPGLLAQEVADGIPAAREGLVGVPSGLDPGGYPALAAADPVSLVRVSSTT